MSERRACKAIGCCRMTTEGHPAWRAPTAWPDRAAWPHRRGRSRGRSADRLDPMRPTMIIDEGDYAVELRQRKISARLAQDLVGLPKLTVLLFQGLQLLGHL